MAARTRRRKPSADPAAVTLQTVAERAGVSLATASRALNGSGTRTVNEDLRTRVLRVAGELGYTANAQAQAVAKGTSNIVAVVVGDIADPYFSTVVSGVVGEAETLGLTVTISTARSDDDRSAATVRALAGQRPRALILAGTQRHDSGARAALAAELDAIERSGSRVCIVGSESEADDDAPSFRTVRVRNRQSAAVLATELVTLGYRDFCVLAGDPGLITPTERAQGFADAAAAAGVPVHERRMLTGPFSRDGAVASLTAALERGERPDCVFAVTDVMAMGAMATLREFGLVPGLDVGVAGFDDIAALQDVTPSLTTVALPLAEIGTAALRAALDPSCDARPAPVDGRVVLRESTPDRRPEAAAR